MVRSGIRPVTPECRDKPAKLAGRAQALPPPAHGRNTKSLKSTRLSEFRALARGLQAMLRQFLCEVRSVECRVTGRCHVVKPIRSAAGQDGNGAERRRSTLRRFSRYTAGGAGAPQHRPARPFGFNSGAVWSET